MKLEKKVKKNPKQNNSNKKKGDHIWHKNKSKSNGEEWNWKHNSNRKMIKNK